MIAACYVVCNEAELIAESIRSVKAYVDQFIIVDSVFHANDIDATHSTDGTRQIAEAAADPVPMTYVESDRKMELDEARNLSISLVPKGGWVLTIDGDETLLGDRDEVLELFDEIRRGFIKEPVGVSVYTAVLQFQGHAPAIGEDAYRVLPVVYTCGKQPRLMPADGFEWHWVPDGHSYGMYRHGVLPKPPPDRRLVIINHRTRQTFDSYQNDYVWESRLL